MSIVYISLGSNMGNRKEQLEMAIQGLREQLDSGLKVSRFYETDPVGYLEQDAFMNCCVRLETQVDPFGVLKVCQTIEEALHRVRIIRWGPRTIDLDLILYDAIELNTEILILPHPRYKERGFVLAPLLDLYDGADRELLVKAYEEVKQQSIRVITYE